MNKADKQMPLEIWTDINGNATRTQFKGGVKYIRADECDRLREALQQALDDIPGWVMLARAALTATSQPTAAEVHQRMFDHGDATSQEGQG